MANTKFQSIKGTHDVLPQDSWRWQRLQSSIQEFMTRYGYREIRTPIFERTELFARGVGQETDIVSKEMYTFKDMSETSLTLKPELTAPVIRSYLQHNLGRLTPLSRLYYISPAFRQERPQAGRFRQHYQYGIEAIGSPYPEMDVEVITIAYELLGFLGMTEMTLKLNSIGSQETRRAYRENLRKFLKPHLPSLSDTSQRRFETNPLRILDTKVPHEVEILKKAPLITDYLTGPDTEHFEEVKSLLNTLEIPYDLDPTLVRGLDYYTHTTFEITTDVLGAQNALCGGGRYDHLVETLGGPSTPAIGFGAGIERLLLALDTTEHKEEPPSTQIFIIALDPEARPIILNLARQLRESGFYVETDTLRRSLKAQMREANRVGAQVVLILGTEELATGTIQLKRLSTGHQERIDRSKLADHLRSLSL